MSRRRNFGDWATPRGLGGTLLFFLCDRNPSHATQADEFSRPHFSYGGYSARNVLLRTANPLFSKLILTWPGLADYHLAPAAMSPRRCGERSNRGRSISFREKTPFWADRTPSTLGYSLLSDHANGLRWLPRVEKAGVL
jgi:hypothetical protein